MPPSKIESGRKRKHEKDLSNEIETVIKKHSDNKCSEPDGFTEKFYQTFRKELAPIFLKLFLKKKL